MKVKDVVICGFPALQNRGRKPEKAGSLCQHLDIYT